MPTEPPPGQPPELLLFAVAFVGVLFVLGLLFVLAQLTYALQRFQRGGITAALQFRGSPNGAQRSKPAYRHRNDVHQRSPRPNAEKHERSAVQAFKKGSALNAGSSGTEGDSHTQTGVRPAPIPTPDELHRLAHAITLYARRPNKQRAIEEAWNCTKGQGEEWQRGSVLFDAAMGDAAMQIAKSKLGVALAPDAAPPGERKRRRMRSVARVR